MHFQLSTKYAIHLLQYLHVHDRGLPTATTISHSIGVTYPLVVKIANELKKHGLLVTVQGRHGGYMLAKPATEISIYDVLLAIEGDLQLVRCLKDKQCSTRDTIGKCSTHDYLLTLQSDMAAFLSRKYVADFSQ